MIASQQSSLPLACILLELGVLGRLRLPSHANRGAYLPRHWRLLVLPPILAALALCSVNLAAHRRFAISPFGNVFLLARVIYDGPGMAALRHDCPTRHWRLCPYLGDFPPISDDFLWTTDSPLNRAGGPKSVSQDADAIIRATLGNRSPRRGPGRMVEHARTAQRVRQRRRPESPGRRHVSPWIKRDFPAREAAAYASARQQSGSLAVPPPLADVHLITAVAGVVACVLLLPVAFTRRAPCFGFLLAVLIALPVSAAITGSLSAPHDRYQSRIMWLPVFIAVVSTAN